MNLSSTARQIVFWLLIIAGALLLYKLVNPRGNNVEKVDLTRLDQMIQAGEHYVPEPRKTAAELLRIS